MCTAAVGGRRPAALREVGAGIQPRTLPDELRTYKWSDQLDDEDLGDDLTPDAADWLFPGMRMWSGEVLMVAGATISGRPPIASERSDCSKWCTGQTPAARHAMALQIARSRRCR